MTTKWIASAGFAAALGLTMLAGSVAAQRFLPKNNPQPNQPQQPRIFNPNPNPGNPNPNPGGQPRIFNPNPNPGNQNPNPGGQPKIFNPPNVGGQPKIINNPIQNPNPGQPKFNPPNIGQPKIINPNQNPNQGPPKLINPPNLTKPNVINPPNITKPNIINPPNLTKPNIINPPNITKPNIINPPNLTKPNVINPPKLVNPNPNNPFAKTPGILPGAKINPKVAPSNVLPKIDAVRNPLVDRTKVDPTKLSAAQKAGILNRQNGEQALIQQAKQLTADRTSAQKLATAAVAKNLPVDQKAKFLNLQTAQVKREADLRRTVANVGPGLLTNNASKLVAHAPAVKTAAAANRMQVAGIDAARLAKIQAVDPVARAAFADAAKNRLVSPAGFAAMQARINDPGLPIRDRVAVARAVGVQGNLYRQTNFAIALNRLGGNPNWGPVVWPPRPGAFVAGFFVGRAVFPGSGIYVPSYWDNTVVLQQNIFFPGNVVGYVSEVPSVYYPPIDQCDVCGGVVVQTLPCECQPAVIDTAYYTPVEGTAVDGSAPQEIPENVQETTPDGEPAVVIDPSAVNAKQVTRYLRLVNSSKEKATVSVLIRTPVDDQGTFAWLPEDPQQAEAAYTVELMPGEERDVYAGDTQMHGSRARIWATGENGRSWRQFENADFWLVPETEEDGTHAYLAPGTETAVYILN